MVVGDIVSFKDSCISMSVEPLGFSCATALLPVLVCCASFLLLIGVSALVSLLGLKGFAGSFESEGMFDSV